MMDQISRDAVLSLYGVRISVALHNGAGLHGGLVTILIRLAANGQP